MKTRLLTAMNEKAFACTSVLLSRQVNASWVMRNSVNRAKAGSLVMLKRVFCLIRPCPAATPMGARAVHREMRQNAQKEEGNKKN